MCIYRLRLLKYVGVHIYIYMEIYGLIYNIYIYIEREREGIEICIYIYIYVYKVDTLYIYCLQGTWRHMRALEFVGLWGL